MICDDCIHNAVCNKKEETEDINDKTIFCGRKHTADGILKSKLKNVNDDLFYSSRLHQDGERYISLTDAIKVLEKYTK